MWVGIPQRVTKIIDGFDRVVDDCVVDRARSQVRDKEEKTREKEREGDGEDGG